MATTVDFVHAYTAVNNSGLILGCQISICFFYEIVTDSMYLIRALRY